MAGLESSGDQECQPQKCRPWSIIFFPSGVVAVCDQFGRQMPKFQAGSHKDAIAALAAAGYPWNELPEVLGLPQL